MDLLSLCMAALLITCCAIFWRRRQRTASRANYISTYRFPRKIKTELIKQYPQLNNAQAEEVLDGLREYFHVCHQAGHRFVSMPSQAVDTAWHQLILFTREYSRFCTLAFGKFLHHTPAEAMSKPQAAQKGIQTAWRISCSRAGINPRSPHSLPLLFSLDTSLAIEDGFSYQLDCTKSGTQNFCASHIAASNSGCGGGCASGSSSSNDSGCGGGCGGGCGS